jgi:bacterioferritin
VCAPAVYYSPLAIYYLRTMSDQQIDKKAVVTLLNEIMEEELAGVVRYTHYSLMVFGHSRIPIVSWLRGEATVCL